MPPSIFDTTDLPALIPRTHCVLIPRDPHFIYAYWDYTREDFDRLQHKLKYKKGNPQLVLRVYDMTHVPFNPSHANHVWDIEVGRAKDWYINVWQDNADYCAQLGFKTGEHHFVPLIRSNTVRTPPKTCSVRQDLIWQDIKPHQESKPYIKAEAPDRLQKAPSHSRVYHLTVQDIRDYYMKLFARVSPKGKRRPPLKSQIPSIENILKPKLGDVSLQKARFLTIRPDLIQEIHPGSSMAQAGMPVAGENFHQGGSEGRLKQRKFFFEIWTELAVHGRTQPDAAVWLNEKGIKLNPDGTFTLRFALPDGEIPLKFMAQSSDSIEMRKIQTRVEREKTIYG